MCSRALSARRRIAELDDPTLDPSRGRVHLAVLEAEAGHPECAGGRIGDGAVNNM